MINYVYQLVSPQVFSIKYEDISSNDDVIIKPRYMALCHADQRYYLGLRDTKTLKKKFPMALIHECCGEVICDNTNNFKPGQKVVMIPNVEPKQKSIIYENYAKGSAFLSSGRDGFMREFVNIKANRVIPFCYIPLKIACTAEFVSVCVHAMSRFKSVSHEIKNTIGIWGDGSLSYVMASVLKKSFPDAKICVVGKNSRKLSLFSFVNSTYLADDIPPDFEVDHAFECAGGEGSYFAIDDIIKYINPQGTVMLMGVSENKVPVNTRNILEKGLTFVGCSRSGCDDFKKAISFMEEKSFHNRLSAIIYEDTPVKNINDIHRVFGTDQNTPFKTVFGWGL